MTSQSIQAESGAVPESVLRIGEGWCPVVGHGRLVPDHDVSSVAVWRCCGLGSCLRLRCNDCDGWWSYELDVPVPTLRFLVRAQLDDDRVVYNQQMVIPIEESWSQDAYAQTVARAHLAVRHPDAEVRP